MKKVIVLGLILVASIFGVNKVFACGTGWFESPCSTFGTESQQSDQNQSRLIQSVPVPSLRTSQERAQISKRAKLFDNENKISYIYLVNFGKVMAFFTVKGKVSSLNSYMVPQDRIVRQNGGSCDSSAASCMVVEAPDLDGAYGKNADGIFFFTTEGAYVEWQGDYMMSDQPLKLSTQPELVREIK